MSTGLVCDERMEHFIAKHADKIEGTLSCFDRLLFRGYLPFFSGAAMAEFLDRRGVQRHALKSFLLRQAYRVKNHAYHLAERQGRPFQYLREKVRKEDLARQIAKRDGIEEGLVCVLTTLEPCRSFSLHWSHAKYVQSARRKCLFLYCYFMDREFGLIHVRIQTWFPMQIQVYVNGHEWLARKLSRHGIGYTKLDNAFLAVKDFRRAQAFADRLALTVNPLLPELLAPMSYYWDVLSFLGRKLHGKFEGEVVTDRFELPLEGRLPGSRVKHRMKQNWLKRNFAYDGACVAAAVMSGEHAMHGFTNRDLRDKLALAGRSLADDPKKSSAQVGRMLHRLHVYALVAKIPRSRRWRVTRSGFRVMSAALSIRHKGFPNSYADAA